MVGWAEAWLGWALVPTPASAQLGQPGIIMVQGGSRYVEGCGGFPYLKIEKFAYFPFMFLIDMKFISNILKICSRGSSSFVGARLRLSDFSKFQNFKIATLSIFQNVKKTKI